jgi:tRNA A-37 threonylcarbamoyl transferase component Bud32
VTPRNTTPEGFRTAAYLATKARLDAPARSRTGKTARGVDCNPPNVKCGGRCIPPNWDCRLEGKGPDPHLRAVRTDPVSGLANIERGVKRLGKGVRKGSFSEIEGGKRAIVRGIVKATPGDLQRKKALQAQLERRAGGIATALAVVGFGLFTHSQLKRAPFYRDGVGRQIDDAVAAGINRILDATPGIRGARAERRAAAAAAAGAAVARAATEAATGPTALRTALLQTPTELERRATAYGNARVLLNRVGAVDVDAAGRGANAETWRQQSLEAFWSTKRTNAAGAGDGSTFSEPATHEYLSRQFGFRLGAGASDTDVRRALTGALNREAASLQALARQQGVNINDAEARSRFLNRLVGPSTANFPENVRERAVGNLNQILGAAPRSREATVSRTELANRIYRETRDGFDQYFGRIADEVRQTPGVAMPTEQRRAGYSDLLNSARIGHARYLAQRLAKPENVTGRIGQGLSDALSKEYFSRQVMGSSTFTLSDRETRTAASELAGRNITGLAEATRYLQQNGFDRLVPVRAAAQPAPGTRAAAPATPPRGRRSPQAQITDLARSLREAAQRRGEEMSLEASYRAARAEIARRQRGDALPPGLMRTATYLAVRADLRGEGKPCGASHIPKKHECRIGAGGTKAAPESGSTKPSGRGKKLALAAGGAALIGATALAGGAAFKNRQNIPLYKSTAKHINTGIQKMSSTKVKDTISKLPEKFQAPANKLLGKAKVGLAVVAADAQGLKLTKVDAANNYSTFKDPKTGHVMSIGAVDDTLVTFVSTPSGKAGAFDKFGIAFQTDLSFDQKQGLSRAQGLAVAKQVKSMFKAQLDEMPENAVLFNNPYKDDGLGAKRTTIYEKFGFTELPGVRGGNMWALKNLGKLTKIPPEQADYVAKLIRGDRADAAEGKPCGNSHIPKAHNCSKTAGGAATAKKPEEGKRTKRLALAAAAGAAAALAITAPAWTPAATKIWRQATAYNPAKPPEGAKLFAQGNNGQVWISKDEKSLIKIPKHRKAALNTADEVATQVTLRSKGVNTPEIYHFDKRKSVVHMEFLKDHSPLAAALKSDNRSMRRGYAKAFTEQLELTHKAGFSHGDLNFNNAMIKDGKLALIDWGFASNVEKKGVGDLANLVRMTQQLDPDYGKKLKREFTVIQDIISSGNSVKQEDILSFYERVRNA